MSSIGKMMVLAGGIIMLLGLVFWFGDRWPIKPGQLPGDFRWQGKNWSVHFPLATSILLSLLLSVVLWLVNRK
ncbi:MAG: DUF2905 domain-containing protein [Bryobacter sp.]|nr:DUF2905 domain-containing protein [Bryobacter sp.]